jgi:hypothetical protein
VEDKKDPLGLGKPKGSERQCGSGQEQRPAGLAMGNNSPLDSLSPTQGAVGEIETEVSTL